MLYYICKKIVLYDVLFYDDIKKAAVLDRIADVTEMNPGAARGDTRLKAGLRRLYEPQYFGIGYTYGDRTGSVAVKTVFENSDIGFNEIAGHYHAMATRDAVNNLVVDRNAKPPGKAHIIEKTGADLVLRTILFNQIVYVTGSDSG